MKPQQQCYVPERMTAGRVSDNDPKTNPDFNR